MLNKIIYTILGFGIAFVFFPHAAHDTKSPAVSGIDIQKAEARPENAAPEMALNLSSPVLTAKSAIAYDLDSGIVLYSKNLDEKLPIASLTKLMTALIVVKSGKLNSEVIIAKSEQGVIGSTMGLVIGEKITANNLLKGMLISSSNDAALALSDFAAGSPEKFAEVMNQQAQRLGLTATHFDNPVGWDSDENYSNTLDLIKMSEEVLKYPELVEIVKTREATVYSVDKKFVHKLTSTNQLLLDDPNVEGLKTGFTSKALGNLVILYDHEGSKILTVVLGSENREQDSKKLLDWLFTVYKW